MNKKSEFAVFGGGCFWCTEAIFNRLKGVGKVTSGYAGGKIDNPSYYDVTSGNTDHAEVIKIEFDPKIISYETLLDVFWHIHDPTSFNRQGADIGSQYRSIILYITDKQRILAENSKKILASKGSYSDKIVTEIKPLDTFYTAEEYHQKFYDKNTETPYCQLIISPKLGYLKKKYTAIMK